MDCAEGTYGQIVDYCENTEQVESVLKKTRVVYITHLHGDHSLGLLRFLEERDKVMKKLPEGEQTKIFVLVPDCMMCYVDQHLKSLDNPELNVVKPHHILNPEEYYMYQFKGNSFHRVNNLDDKPHFRT